MDNEIYKGYTIKIEYDEIAESPREWDNLGKIVAFHNRYELGDKTDYKSENYESWTELEKAIEENEQPAVILPVYLYDHSGLRIKVGSFQGLLPQGHAEFDSGKIGYIFATKKAIRENFNIKRITDKILVKVVKILENEIKTYDAYVSGQVYYYSIEDQDGENIDSCGGFYDYDDVLSEAKSTIDHVIAEKLAKKIAKVKGYIKNQVELIYRQA